MSKLYKNLAQIFVCLLATNKTLRVLCVSAPLRALFLLIAAHPHWAVAAETIPGKAGQILGLVLDHKSREPMLGVNIRVLGSRFGAVTDSEGKFVIARVPAGTYTLEASRMGYEKQQHEKLSVRPDSSARIAFELVEAEVSLNEIVVTPGSFSIMREEPSVQQTLSREDIQSIPQFGEDIYRAIKRLPGIASNDYSARFTVRGGEHHEILVLLDGLELYEPFHLKDINGGALSIIDVQAIGGITLMTGGFSAEYGNRLSGVFNITSAAPDNARSKTAIGLSFMNARFMSEGAFAGNQGQWLVSARRGYLDLIMGIVEPDSKFRPTYYDVLSKAEYRLSRNHTLAAHLLHAGDDLDLEEDGDTVATGYGNSYAWLTLKSFPSTKLFAQTVASFGYVKQDRLGSDTFDNGKRVRAEVDDLRSFNVYGLKQDWSFTPNTRHLMKWGLGFKQLRAEYDYFNRELIFSPTSVDYDTIALALRPKGHDFNFYLADRMRVTSALTAELGLRYDYTSYTNGKHLSPRLSLAYALGKNTTLRLGWGRFRQEQGIHELQVEDGDEKFYPAELAEHRVLGLEQQFENGLNLRVEGYHKRLSQLRPRPYNLSGELDFFPEVEGDRIRVEPASGEAKGLEFFLKKDSNGKFGFWGSYALAFVEEKIDGKMTPRNFDQRHTIYLDFAYRPNPRLRLNLAWHYHTGWPATASSIEKEQRTDGGTVYRTVYGSRNASRYPAYHSLDVKLNRYFEAGSSRISVFLECVNFYNRGNVSNYFYEDVTQANGEVLFVQKAEHWFPRLPSLGISWEF